MHVAFVSTYPPTACGLATYTQDLRRALLARPGVEASVVAVKSLPLAGAPPEEVLFEIRRRERKDYAAAAEFVNATSVEAVCLQHEFGIFGGPEGAFVTDFLERLQKPVVTTLHTVLPQPSAPYHEALLAVAERSDHLVVMSERARTLLQDTYRLSEKISVIHHGVPEFSFDDPDAHKAALGMAGRTVLMTFGLLSPGKGIELVLEALPAVVRAHPEVLYVVLGATHPEVKRQEGERYRRSLMARVRALGLQEHVRFVDQFVEKETLFEYLRACDVYVTPYPGRDQICSGTLAYALGAGKAIVSTPYLYAEELLADGRGRLVDFGNVEAMRDALRTLAGDRQQRDALRRAAYAFGQQMTWGTVGQRYLDAFEEVTRCGRAVRQPAISAAQRAALARVSLDYLAALSDDTGVFQHAAYGVPDRRHGYCTDDAGRALVVALRHHAQTGDRGSLALARTYLSFLQHAQHASGHFHNFMSFTRQFVDEEGSEDTVGRALWGLGAAVAWGPTPALRVLARQMIERALYLDLHHPRGLAYAICGLDLFLKRYPGAAEVRHRMGQMAHRLAGQYAHHSQGRWRWFHDALTYSNAKLPQALLLAYRAVREEHFKKIGLSSLSFLIENTYHDGQFDFVGNQGWYRRGAARATFGQQPIEAGYTAETCMTAYEVTGEPQYRTLALAAVDWFLGRNRLGARLYDPKTGTCTDGLEDWGPNLNQGAESVIACLLALQAAAPGLSAQEPGDRPARPSRLPAPRAFVTET